MTEDGIETPNCERCLTRLDLIGNTEHPYYWCPSCKVAHLT
ncbi:hypothetical protein [Marisediminicola sp. LYQ134]